MADPVRKPEDENRPTDPNKKKQDEKLDEAVEDTFPASDPVSLVQPPPSKPDKKS